MFRYRCAVVFGVRIGTFFDETEICYRQKFMFRSLTSPSNQSTKQTDQKNIDFFLELLLLISNICT
jgi:hypothetical protein